MEMSAAIIDTETNDRDNAEVIELAWLEIDFGNPTTISAKRTGNALAMLTNEPVCFRFQPVRPVTLGAMATHHITTEMLQGEDPSSMAEIPPFEFITGHNIDFDAKALGIMDGPKRIDTCALARAIWPELDCYSQSALLYHLDRANARERLQKAHSAAADVLICKTILDHEIAATGVQSWEELWQHSEIARVPVRMAFGKHRGVLIKDLDPGYKRWLLNATDPPIDEYLRKALTGDTQQRTLFCPQ